MGDKEVKLSMWNIYNELKIFEPEVHIAKNSPMILKSARLVYATDCVLIKSDGKNSIISWNDDYIRLQNVSSSEALELIQNIFDHMSEWNSSMFKSISEHNFQDMVDICHDVFNNPIILFDNDHKILGISSQYGPDDVDDEWHYLKNCHSASFNALNIYNQNQTAPNPAKAVITTPFANSGIEFKNLAIDLTYNNQCIGHISVVNKNRAINTGDIQMINFIADMLKPTLFNHEQQLEISMPYTTKLINGVALSTEDIDQLHDIYGWQKEHSYQVYLLYFNKDEKNSPTSSNSILQQIIYSLHKIFPRDQYISFNNYIIFLSNNSLTNCKIHQNSIYDIVKYNYMHASCSLSLYGIEFVPQLVEQAKFAKNLGELSSPDELIHPFYNYALDYLITSPYNSKSHTMACHPDLFFLHPQADHGSRMLYETLHTYLVNERSTKKTIEKLFIHKNTLNYRLHKLEEFLQCDLDDEYTRKYLLISFSVLERNSLYSQAKLFSK